MGEVGIKCVCVNCGKKFVRKVDYNPKFDKIPKQPKYTLCSSCVKQLAPKLGVGFHNINGYTIYIGNNWGTWWAN